MTPRDGVAVSLFFDTPSPSPGVILGSQKNNRYPADEDRGFLYLLVSFDAVVGSFLCDVNIVRMALL